MEFKDRLRKMRTEAHISQAALAEKAGITVRTVQNYELGTRMPHNMRIAEALATALGTSVEGLLGRSGVLTVDACEKGGRCAARDVSGLVSEVTGLFAGGTLPEEDMDAVMEALSAAYWDAKRKNKKYGRQKQGAGDAE